MKIILIGTGNIGKRHLQALCNLDAEIACTDISLESLESVQNFLEENKLKADKLTHLKGTDDAINQITPETFVIVATTANGRKDILLKAMEKKPKAIITEKPVVQKKEEYAELIEKQKQTGTAVYVNFSRHMYPTYHKISEGLKSSGPSSFFGRFPRIGMACNGLHYIELMTWLLRAEQYEIKDSAASAPYETKRAGFLDITGHILLTLNSNNTGFISIAEEDTVNSIDILSSKKIYKVLEAKGTLLEVDEKIHVEDFQLLHTSQITDKVIKDIIAGKKPNLPTIEECRLAHEILFDVLERHKLTDLNFT